MPVGVQHQGTEGEGGSKGSCGTPAGRNMTIRAQVLPLKCDYCDSSPRNEGFGSTSTQRAFDMLYWSLISEVQRQAEAEWQSVQVPRKGETLQFM